MSDLALLWTTPFGADLTIVQNDIVIDDGLKTAVMLSLFTDRRALDADTLPGNSTDRRGFWGDALPVVPNDQIGSRLWLLARAKQTQDVLARAKAYALEALQWMLDDSVASAIDVQVAFTEPGVLGISVVVSRPKETARSFQFGYAWAAEAAAEGF